MGKAVLNVNIEKIQNKVATIIGENQKNLMSLPDRIPIKSASAGLTTKNKVRHMIIPASGDANSTASKGIISIIKTADRIITIVRFSLLNFTTCTFFRKPAAAEGLTVEVIFF